jgi:hypothetical protein
LIGREKIGKHEEGQGFGFVFKKMIGRIFAFDIKTFTIITKIDTLSRNHVIFKKSNGDLQKNPRSRAWVGSRKLPTVRVSFCKIKGQVLTLKSKEGVLNTYINSGG